MNVKPLVLAAALSIPLSAAGQAPTPSEAAPAAMVPTTADDHANMARDYEQKAAAWRKEATYHREMAKAYKASHPDAKGGARNSEAVKMEKHCMAIVKDAEKLAADAEWAAKYHSQRAKELAGK